MSRRQPQDDIARLLILQVLIFSAMAAACAGARTNSSPDAPRSGPDFGRPAATTTNALPTAPSAQALATPSIEVEPLGNLSGAAAGLLADQAAGGIAVIAPSSGRTYGIRANDQFPLASVAKVPIMLTLLDEEMQQGQSPDDDQMELLRSMITTSDNDSADELWNEIGGGAAVDRYLQSIGVHGFSMKDDDDWGHSTASPLALATLLLKLARGETLDRSRRDIAVGLLSEVEPDQRWGVSVAFPDSPTIGIKNGWYPDDAGWWVNSAGVDWSSASPMVMVIMLGDQPSFDDGVAAIESTATLVAEAIHANAAAGKP